MLNNDNSRFSTSLIFIGNIHKKLVVEKTRILVPTIQIYSKKNMVFHWLYGFCSLVLLIASGKNLPLSDVLQTA